MILPDFSPRSPAARIPQPAKPATAPKPMSVHSKHPGKDKTARPAPVATPGLFEPSAAPAIPDLPVLGIDIAKATFRACLLPNRGERSAEADFANSPEGFHALAAWLKKHSAPRTRAALEATGHYSQALLAFLHAAGHHVSLLNPRWIKDYARSEGRRNKTDAADARVIARYVRTHATRPWQPRTEAESSLQALSRRRAHIVGQLTAEKVRLQNEPAATAPLTKNSIAHFKRQLVQIDQAITKLLRADAALQRAFALLQSIPGIGRATAIAILAELPPLESFERVRDAAAWAGLTPALCESGTSVRGRSRMSKQGNGRLRKALYMPALVLLRAKRQNALTTFATRLREAGKPPMIIIGALMRKLFQTACGVLKHDCRFNPSLA